MSADDIEILVLFCLQKKNKKKLGVDDHSNCLFGKKGRNISLPSPEFARGEMVYDKKK